MDIIAAHQQGLFKQLELEVAALAGRACDHGQRAVVLHHLYDHSCGHHVWALAEARRALRISAGIAALRRRLARWGWMIGRRDEARAALDLLAEALGQASRARAALAYRAYRLTATAALRGKAEEILPSGLLGVVDQCHAARRAATDLCETAIDALHEESEQLAKSAADPARLDAAWAAIDATGIGRAARRLLDDEALVRWARRDEQRGWFRAERQLRDDPALPASFRANPAQHFYALRGMLKERRRQEWREACDREEDAFELAA
jgi:hypothetical protein